MAMNELRQYTLSGHLLGLDIGVFEVLIVIFGILSRLLILKISLIMEFTLMFFLVRKRDDALNCFDMIRPTYCKPILWKIMMFLVR